MNTNTRSNLMGAKKRKCEPATEQYKDLDSFARVTHTESSIKRSTNKRENEQTLAYMEQPTHIKRERLNSDGLENRMTEESDFKHAILPEGEVFEDDLNATCAVEIKGEYVLECEPQEQATNQQTDLSHVNENHSRTLTDIFDLLKTISQKMSAMETRIAAIERMVQENGAKCQLIAQNQLMRENLAVTKIILKSTKRLLGDDMDEVEVDVATRLPLATMADVMDLEERLKEPEFENSMKTHLAKIKGTSTIHDMFRQLIEDKLVDEYNWDGRNGKRALRSLTLFNKILPDIFRSITFKDLEKYMRKCVELSHNRYKHRKYSDRRKLNVVGPDQVPQMKPQ